MRYSCFLVIALLVACVSQDGSLSKREGHRLSSVTPLVEVAPREAIGRLTLFLERPGLSPTGRATALQLRAIAHAKKTTPDWLAYEDDLEDALAIVPSKTAKHRSITNDLVTLALARRDPAYAIALLTSEDLAAGQVERDRLLAALAHSAAGRKDPSANAPSFRSKLGDDHDAKPLVRVPPRGFERCFGRRPRVDAATVSFDVDETGRTRNVKVVATTDSCFNRYAIRAVEKWRYSPAHEAGEPVSRQGVRATLHFTTEKKEPTDETNRPEAPKALQKASL